MTMVSTRKTQEEMLTQKNICLAQFQAFTRLCPFCPT